MNTDKRKALVSPQTLKGFQDHLPESMVLRNQVAKKIVEVYERFGFQPIDTPVLEYLMTLIGTGGEETNKELFRLESPEREPIAMRYDLTVPLARILAQYKDDIKLPFRRYHFGPVFRADKPSVGRYRQFTQFDVDVAGTDSVAVDAEIVAVMCAVMQSVGLENSTKEDETPVRDFLIRINNRKLVDALLEGCGITQSEVQKHVLRVIDKLQKVGVDEIRKELGEGRIDDSGDPIKGVGLKAEVIEKVLEFISVKENTRTEVVDSLARLLPDSDASQNAIREMRQLAQNLECLQVKELDAVFDPSLARGLDYYTGPVFEGCFVNAPEVGSVMGGGRYDHLVERFLDTPVPGTGVSIGFDRFVTGLLQLEKLHRESSITQVLIISLGAVPESELLKAATELRNAGISTEVYFGQGPAGMRAQLSFANARSIPIAVIVGEDEFRNGQVAVKDLQAGFEKRADIQDREQYRKAGKTGQITVERSELVKAVREMLP